MAFVDPTRALASFTEYKTGVEPVLADADVRNKVGAVANDLQVQNCIQFLDDVARLLECAIALSYDHQCHASMLSLAIQYQTLVDAFCRASSTHLQTSMEALKHFKLTFFSLRKHEIDDARSLLAALPSLAARSEGMNSSLLDQVTDFLRDVNARLQVVNAAINAVMRDMVLAKREDRAAHEYAVMSLERTMKVLGIMKAKLENVRCYVAMSKDRCCTMAEPNTGLKTGLQLATSQRPDMVVKAMTQDWYEWLALAKTNDASVRGMDGVRTAMHRILSTLPTAAPASDRLAKLMQHLQSGH
ncbi:hypothetical protein SDRG_09758 [Saprolegnia diclina VS20]|uniref:Uncharacterized protein n=1 Tax=Saprolegnia diclina (strain VS20) TaxID=1156394 RepID=T0RRM2_SAPDV|nr:hypothetical protein SDRG_09758 [Saprolegnia diclina VS20]EQC32787.1 hypothetical protein SDRG_09758 [Saprolegnia diclina VS20]|eukprot:XP_008613931.1 hypothetical protein SDRG_09758 [Saprolegnia diclina VS20]